MRVGGKYLKARLFLQRAIGIDEEIKSKREQIAMWRSLAESTTRPLGGDLNGGGGASNRMEECVVKIADAESELQDMLKKLCDIRREVTDIIARLPNRKQRLVLEQYYLCGKSWDSISKQLNYCPQYLRQNVYTDALREVEKLLKD
jgi:hypothetical protein